MITSSSVMFQNLFDPFPWDADILII